MAEIRLDLDEADGRLPDVCMCCGDASTTLKTKSMSWCPPWVGVLIVAGALPYVIVAMIMTKRARVQVPLCDRHHGHWLYRHLIVWGLFGFLLLLSAAAGLIVAILPGRHQDTIGPFACIAGLVFFVGWLIVLIVAQSTAIRPKEITQDEIVLQGVSDAFVEAVQTADEERRARRKKKRARVIEQDDDDEAFEAPKPRKKRPPLDAIEE
jgi:hypothetical protein